MFNPVLWRKMDTICNLDLAPPATYLFPVLKKKRLAGNKHETRAALISTVNRYLSIRSTKSPMKMAKCIDAGGEYFEKE